jgi:hypothetical protein
MRKVLFFTYPPPPSCVQELTLPADVLNDDATVAKSMPELAKRVIETSTVNRDIGRPHS